MKKAWTERRLFTDEQIAAVQPNETQDGVILLITEATDLESQCRLYLSYDEAEMLAKQLKDFVMENYR